MGGAALRFPEQRGPQSLVRWFNDPAMEADGKNSDKSPPIGNPYAAPARDCNSSDRLELGLVYRIGCALCTVYVLLPSVVGVLTLVGLLVGSPGPAPVAGIVCCAVPGIPIGILQLYAVFSESATAARSVALVLAFISVVTAIGVLGDTAAAVMGKIQNGSNRLGLEEALIAAGLLSVNTLAAYFMFRLASAYARASASDEIGPKKDT